MLEHATLTDMDDDVRRELERGADAVEHGSDWLKTAIHKAVDAGERPADITRAIGHVWTYDYVAKIVREYKARS